MERVAQDGPEELGLWVARFAQQLEAVGRRLLEHAGDDLIGLFATGDVLTGREIQAVDVFADLLVKAAARLLAQRAFFDQAGQHLGRGIHRIERVGLQVVLHRLHHVCHRVQAHHVGRAEGAARCAAQLLAGQVVDNIDRQAELLGLDHRGHHAGDADAVGDEVGRVIGAHDALADGAGDEAFQLVNHFRQGGRRVDQLDQVHVARRIEKMDAAKAWLDFFGQHVGQLGDRQARGVGRDDGVRRDEGRDLLVEIELPVHALGNRLDDQVALAQQLQVLFVIGLLDQHGVGRVAQRRRLELLQSVDGLADDAVLRAILGGQVKQDDRHLDVDEVSGDLRAHHARAEHGDFANLKSTHWKSLGNGYSTRSQTCVRPNIGMPT